jgi:DNA-binding response OmpR family regulator
MQKPQILLVEDTLELATLISAELRAAGFEVQHCEQGEAALHLLKSQSCDLLILDWMLPDIAGIEVLRQLRSVSGLPVLMLTARDTELDRVLGLELGADDYLATPPFADRTDFASRPKPQSGHARIGRTADRPPSPPSELGRTSD